MQTQWSTGANEGNGGVEVEGGPMSAGGDHVAGDAGRDGAGTPVDESPVLTTMVDEARADDAVSEVPADGTEGEEEAHRSAVDAVDGLLDEVELALARLDDGTYGRCEECGAPIGDARLADSPIERTCGSCVIGGSGAADAVSGPPYVTDAARTAAAPVGLSAATGHHGD